MICWNGQGTAFEIKDMKLFSSAILVTYFRTANFYSFVRQLNIYGFSKTNTQNHLSSEAGASIHKFHNVNFQRDRPELLGRVTRKRSETEKKKRRKSVDILLLCKEAKDIEVILKDFNTRLSDNEDKASFLELCNKELEVRNVELKQNLLNLAEKEKNLEKYLLVTLTNFAPGILNKSGNTII